MYKVLRIQGRKTETVRETCAWGFGRRPQRRAGHTESWSTISFLSERYLRNFAKWIRTLPLDGHGRNLIIHISNFLLITAHSKVARSSMREIHYPLQLGPCHASIMRDAYHYSPADTEQRGFRFQTIDLLSPRRPWQWGWFSWPGFVNQ